MECGHTSGVVVSTVIGDQFRKVVDSEVLSSFCKSCDMWKTKQVSPEYNAQKENHEKVCFKRLQMQAYKGNAIREHKNNLRCVKLCR